MGGVATLLAGAAMSACVVGLRLAWGGQTLRALWLATATAAGGSALIAADAAMGAERGTATVLVTITVPALVLVAANARWRPRMAEKERVVGAPAGPAGPSLAAGWFAAGPAGLSAALALTATTAIWLPLEPSLRVILALILFPLFWSVFAGWGLATSRPARAALMMTGLALLGGGTIMARQAL